MTVHTQLILEIFSPYIFGFFSCGVIIKQYVWRECGWQRHEYC